MKKFLTLLLAAFTLAFSVTVSACSVETRDPSSSFAPDSTVESSSPEVETPSGEPFTARLQLPEGESLDTAAGLYAIWTEKGGLNVYQAPFNAQGVATCTGPDGEYQVTLSATPTGYTYNPNIYLASNDDRDTEITLYPLRELAGIGNHPYETPYGISTEGAYRFTFTKPEEKFYFKTDIPRDGTISFKSLLDVTKNETLPVLERGLVSNEMIQNTIIGGGEQSSYTKNFYASYSLKDNQQWLYFFKIGVESMNPSAYPVVVDMLVEVTDYEDEYTNLVKAEVPDIKLPHNRTAGDPWRATEPAGEFVLLADVMKLGGGKRIPFEGDMVKKVYNEETKGYFYYLNEEFWNAKYPDHPITDLGKKMLYARLGKDVPGVNTTTPDGTAHNLGLSFRTDFRCPLPVGQGKDYGEFIAAYLAKKNSNGDYPVDEYMMQFLEDYSISHRIFFDGYGSAEWGLSEANRYSASADGRWLFACGFYTEDTIG